MPRSFAPAPSSSCFRTAGTGTSARACSGRSAASVLRRQKVGAVTHRELVGVGRTRRGFRLGRRAPPRRGDLRGERDVTDPKTQVREVVRRFELAQRHTPIRTLLGLHGLLRGVDKDAAHGRIPLRTALWINEYREYPDCHRLYWREHSQRAAAGRRRVHPRSPRRANRRRVCKGPRERGGRRTCSRGRGEGRRPCRPRCLPRRRK